MARCLLVSFAGRPVMASSFFPDNGLASLASTLHRAGHEATVLDYNTVSVARRLVPPERTGQLRRLLAQLEAIDTPEFALAITELEALLAEDLENAAAEMAEEISRRVESSRIDLVGFKLWSGDGFDASVAIATQLRKRHPGLVIVGGGPAVTYSGDAIYSRTDVFDALVDGEGEEAILGIAWHADLNTGLSDVPNLILPSGGRGVATKKSLMARLDDMPFPKYEASWYPSLKGNDHIRMFVLDESRGCPVGCAFCIHGTAAPGSWRLRSAEHVLEFLCDLRSRLGVRAFRLGGSYTPRRFLDALADGLSGSAPRWAFSAYAHPNVVAAGDPARWASVGCQSLFLGVESFDPEDLSRIGKRSTPEQARRAIRAAVAAGIVPVVSLIVPLPGQTIAALRANRDEVLNLLGGGRGVLATQFPALLPGTRWWTDRGRHGFTLEVAPDEYRGRLASYKIRHIAPAKLWQAPGYAVGAMSFRDFAGVNWAFQRAVAGAGVPVNISDDAVTVARLVGWGLEETAKRMADVFLALDVAEMASLVCEANAVISDG